MTEVITLFRQKLPKFGFTKNLLQKCQKLLSFLVKNPKKIVMFFSVLSYGITYMSHLISGGGHSDSRPEPARRDCAETGAELPGPGLPAAGSRPFGALPPPSPHTHVQGIPQ